MTPEQESLIEALHRVELGSAAWQPFARLALHEAATRWDRLTSDHVWRVLVERRIPFPREGRAMAPVMLHGKKVGWIEPTATFETVASPATGRHPGPQRVYVSRLVGALTPQWPEPPDIRMAVQTASAAPGPPGATPAAVTGSGGGDPVPQHVRCPRPGCDQFVFLFGRSSFDSRYWDAQCPNPKHGRITVRA